MVCKRIGATRVGLVALKIIGTGYRKSKESKGQSGAYLRNETERSGVEWITLKSVAERSVCPRRIRISMDDYHSG